jgi:hypothetical protein
VGHRGLKVPSRRTGSGKSAGRRGQESSPGRYAHVLMTRAKGYGRLLARRDGTAPRAARVFSLNYKLNYTLALRSAPTSSRRAAPRKTTLDSRVREREFTFPSGPSAARTRGRPNRFVLRCWRMAAVGWEGGGESAKYKQTGPKKDKKEKKNGKK